MVIFQIILAFIGLGVVALLAILGILALSKGLIKAAVQFIYDLRPEDKKKGGRE